MRLGFSPLPSGSAVIGIHPLGPAVALAFVRVPQVPKCIAASRPGVAALDRLPGPGWGAPGCAPAPLPTRGSIEGPDACPYCTQGDVIDEEIDVTPKQDKGVRAGSACRRPIPAQFPSIASNPTARPKCLFLLQDEPPAQAGTVAGHICVKKQRARMPYRRAIHEVQKSLWPAWQACIS